MSYGLPNSPDRSSSSFRKVVGVFLSSEGLPFAKILTADRIERIFAKHGCLFGVHGIYTTAIMIWSFLSQVLRDGKEASCQAAVARVVSYCEQSGIDSPTSDTGDYCRARAKLSEAALHELSCEVANELEAVANETWLWKSRHAKLIDGFTFTMPDTPENQAEYPQHKAQQPGVGQPIARAVAVLSLAMVRRELWTTLLGYNLIRTTAAGAALVYQKQPRQINFTSTCQYVLASWMLMSCGLIDPVRVNDYRRKLLEQIAQCEVANRPGRLEPRVLK